MFNDKAILDQIHAEIRPRMETACAAFAGALATAWPTRTGRTRGGITYRVVTAGDADAYAGRKSAKFFANSVSGVTGVVRIPFPAQFVEFGHGKVAPRAIARRTLVAMRGELTRILSDG